MANQDSIADAMFMERHQARELTPPEGNVASASTSTTPPSALQKKNVSAPKSNTSSAVPQKGKESPTVAPSAKKHGAAPDDTDPVPRKKERQAHHNTESIELGNLTPQNDFSGGNKCDVPTDFLERVHRSELHSSHLRVSRYNFSFSFVNLEHFNDPLMAHMAMSKAIQKLFDELSEKPQEGDLVQTRLEGGGLNNPLFYLRRHKGDLNAEDFLNNTENLVQSNAEIHISGLLCLVVSIIRNRGGRGRRDVNSILYSKIIHKKRRHLTDFNNIENLCFGMSLVSVMADNRLTSDQVLQEARQMYMQLGFADDQKIMLTDVKRFEELLGVNIGVVMHDGKKWIRFMEPPVQKKSYFLLLHNEHYYGILNVKGFFGSKHYCTLCGMPYARKHSCKFSCRLCLRRECADEGSVKCPNCRLVCMSKQCLIIHEDLARKNQIDCSRKILCSHCGRYVPEKHKCKLPKCRECLQDVTSASSGDTGHQCFIPPLSESVVSEKYIFYDIECRQDSGIHIPNYIFATDVHDKDEWEFRGDDCLSGFLKKFIDTKFKGFTFLAHNAKGYDSYFIVKQLVKEKMDIQLIVKGGQLMCVTVKKLGIKFKDSLNFLPMKLSKLPKAMGFEMRKEYFPHFFNTVENQNYLGPLPEKKFYGYDFMMPDEREDFLRWYEENKGKTFDLQKALAYYCQKDVKILRQACRVYREEILKMTSSPTRCGIDAFQFLTIASVAMSMYRYLFLQEKKIAILPGDNYHRQTKRFSTPSIQWLMYLEHKDSVEIRHALKGGEKKEGPYFLDGYAEDRGERVAFEFYGCFFHGCPNCYNEKEVNPMLGSTYGQLHYKTQRKEDYLKRKGFKIRSIWEHKWRAMVDKDSAIKEFLREKNLPQPIQPRDAFFGGRTNAITLYYKPKEGEKIRYYDFTSLYPFVNKTKEYPIGHPEIIYQNFGPIDTYFGLVKTKVLPPRGLFFPVLPMRVGEKLLFPLCRTCAENTQLEQCKHSDEERALHGTWVSIELMKAIEKGYRVLEIDEIWHFGQHSDELFSEYVNMHLREKQEASGYPTWCTDDQKKQEYIDKFKAKEDVELRPDKIEVNPAKRQIAKLFLNSLWGKFGQQPNKINTTIVRDTETLLNFAFSPAYNISGFEILDEGAVTMSWRKAKERFTLTGNTNVVIAAFTTAYARLELYKLLDELQERCLYHDTDSVIFVDRDGVKCPLLGDYLGDLTSEIPPQEHITEFVSGGPKTYGFRLSGGGVCMKVKGITLHALNAEKVNFDSLKEMVLDYNGGKSNKIVLSQEGILRNKKQWSIETGPLKKTLQVVYDKRILMDEFKTLPYGY